MYDAECGEHSSVRTRKPMCLVRKDTRAGARSIRASMMRRDISNHCPTRPRASSIFMSDDLYALYLSSDATSAYTLKYTTTEEMRGRKRGRCMEGGGRPIKKKVLYRG